VTSIILVGMALVFLSFVALLTAAEAARLRSQTVISNTRGGRRHRPYVFTEQVLQCCLPFCEAIVPLRSISKSCARLCDCAASLDHMLISRKSWTSSSESTTVDSSRSSTRFGTS